MNFNQKRIIRIDANAFEVNNMHKVLTISKNNIKELDENQFERLNK
jgi:hypothetical protein